MDKEKLKKFAGYAGLGSLGGLFCFIVLTGVGAWGGCSSYILILIIITGLVGGLPGGFITKKWWGALVGGFILMRLIMLILGWLLNLAVRMW